MMKANLMQAEETSPPPPSSAPSGAQLNNTQAAAAIVSSPHSADAAATAAAVTAAMNAGQNFLMAAAAAAAASTGGGGREGPMGVPGVAPGTIDLALQQRLQQQFIHRQILEHQMHQQRNLQQFAVEERQLSVLLQQAQLRKAKEEQQSPTMGGDQQQQQQQQQPQQPQPPYPPTSNAAPESDKLRLEILKQKSSQEQSAVASPEVKRHLQEFVLQKKRKEASMTNLKLVPTAVPPPQPILRKTASESNLLKMKKTSKRASGSTGPYPGASSRLTHPAIPETAAIDCCSSSNSSNKSQNNSPPIELGSPSSYAVASSAVSNALDHHRSSVASSAASSQGSAPSSPKTAAAVALASMQLQRAPHLGKPQRSLDTSALMLLSSSAQNSKSLPNIPSAVSRLAGKESNSSILKRKSPPPTVSFSAKQSVPAPHHGGLIVRRSKSSAILPLRKHLIERSLQEQKKQAMDEEQFYYQQKQQIARERLMIRPIEEVMEEDQQNRLPSNDESMEVDDAPANNSQQQQQQQQQQPTLGPAFTARVGHAGLSPLVLSEVGSSISSDYVSKLLPRQPLDLARTTSNDTLGLGAANGCEQTGLGYDPLMLKHACRCETGGGAASSHPENPNRMLAIWNRLVESGLSDRCVRVARRATLEEIQSCHTEQHTLVYGTDMVNLCSLTGSQELHRESRIGKFCRLDCGGVGIDSDTYWNEQETPAAVRTAVGTFIELSQKVCREELRNGFAVIRPPGHHAEADEAMGFCYFNSVAIAAKQLRLHMPQLARRILIIDWAIHHGNGTQKLFYDDPNVLYLSLHRHDNGNFYPGTGGPVECGSGPGLGFNVNIAWSGGLEPPMGDAEYLAAFRAVVLPIARAYDPDIVLVSAGFDAAAGHAHPIGGYLVSTACFAYLTHQLRQVANGKVVLALEGGFELDVLADAAEQCVRALIGLPIEKIEECELARRPCPSAAETLQKTLAIQTPYWEILRRSPESALLSHLEAWEKSREENETLNAMASLSVEASQQQQQQQQRLRMPNGD